MSEATMDYRRCRGCNKILSEDEIDEKLCECGHEW